MASNPNQQPWLHTLEFILLGIDTLDQALFWRVTCDHLSLFISNFKQSTILFSGSPYIHLVRTINQASKYSTYSNTSEHSHMLFLHKYQSTRSGKRFFRIKNDLRGNLQNSWSLHYDIWQCIVRHNHVCYRRYIEPEGSCWENNFILVQGFWGQNLVNSTLDTSSTRQNIALESTCLLRCSEWIMTVHGVSQTTRGSIIPISILTYESGTGISVLDVIAGTLFLVMLLGVWLQCLVVSPSL